MVNRQGGRRGFENRWCRKSWCRKSWCRKSWCHKSWCHKAWASSAPAIRQSEGQPAGRSASVGSGLDAQALWIKTTAFRHGESIRAAPDPRSKRVSGVKPWRSTRRLSANFSQLSRREVRDPGSLISCSRRIRLPPLQPIRAGWALVSPTLCKSAVHSEVVRIHPCPAKFLPTKFLPTKFLPTKFLPTKFCLPPTKFLPTKFLPTKFAAVAQW